MAALLLLACNTARAVTGPVPACGTAPPPGIAAPGPGKTLVLIIDDMGNQLRNGRAVVALPGKLTVAVLPHTPHGARLARAAHAAGKEVMLHAPMSNLAGTPLGRGGLTSCQSEEKFRATLAAALNSVPHTVGVNNHMGSELTQQPTQMAWVMEELRERGLYFIDSRTSALTVAARTAGRYRVPHLSRKVFIDNSRERAAIEGSFQRLLEEVERTGLAVGIGHPYPETIDYLRAAMPRLPCRGIRLALVSEALDRGEIRGPATPPSRPLAGAELQPGSEPYFDAPPGHVGLGLGYGVFPEVKYAGGQHGIGAADQDALHEVLQVTDTP